MKLNVGKVFDQMTRGHWLCEEWWWLFQSCS